MRIYISPSTQEHNAYTGGGNEEAQMRAICFPVADLLRSAGHIVKVGGTVSATANANDGNSWGAQLYVAVHSNAGGGVGTEGWYYTGSVKGKALAQAVYNRVCKVSDAPDRGIKATTALLEVSRPKAPATIIELAFHDDASDAAEIRTSHAEYARAIAQGVLDVAGGAIPVPVTYIEAREHLSSSEKASAAASAAGRGNVIRFYPSARDAWKSWPASKA